MSYCVCSSDFAIVPNDFLMRIACSEPDSSSDSGQMENKAYTRPPYTVTVAYIAPKYPSKSKSTYVCPFSSRSLTMVESAPVNASWRL
eukprot:31198-Pelagococcus_subviridis.AAC.70